MHNDRTVCYVCWLKERGGAKKPLGRPRKSATDILKPLFAATVPNPMVTPTVTLARPTLAMQQHMIDLFKPMKDSLAKLPLPPRSHIRPSLPPVRCEWKTTPSGVRCTNPAVHHTKAHFCAEHTCPCGGTRKMDNGTGRCSTCAHKGTPAVPPRKVVIVDTACDWRSRMGQQCTNPFVHRDYGVRYCNDHRCSCPPGFKMHNGRDKCSSCIMAAHKQDNTTNLELGQCTYWSGNDKVRCTEPAVHGRLHPYCDAHRCRTCTDTMMRKMVNNHIRCAACYKGNRIARASKRPLEADSDDDDDDPSGDPNVLRKLRSHMPDDNEYEPPKKRIRVE